MGSNQQSFNYNLIAQGCVNAPLDGDVEVDETYVGGLGPTMDGEYTKHRVVKHNQGEYVVDGDVHTNSIESIWALFKRQLIGTHHWVSKKHLQAYVDEMTWRFNRRDQEEGQRVNSLLKQVEGRLTYEELTA